MLELWIYLYLLPAPPPCVAEVRWPGLALEPPAWAFITETPRPCKDLRPSAAWLYRFNVDPAAPVEAEEYEGDVYEDDAP